MFCNKCKQDLPESEFWARKDRKHGHRSKFRPHCKTCTKNQVKNWRDKNRTRFNKNACRYHKKYWQRNEQFIIDYLTKHPCIDCGESDVNILEFDHIKGKKLRGIAVLKQYASLNTLQKEIDKCVVRCPNCHRRRHHKEGLLIS